jgi:hypothetical protein
MTRILFASIFAALLMTSAPLIAHAEDAAPAADEKKAEEPKAEEKKADEAKPVEEKKEEAKADDAQQAAEKAAVKAADKPAEEEIPKGVAEHQQAAQEVFDLTKKIAEGLSPEEQKHFFLIYNNYNLIGTVKMVQTDVGNAVKACGDANPDMKDAMSTRFGKWNDAVNPVIKEAQGNVDNMVIAQEYAKPADIKKVFKGLDKTRTLANKQIEKTPVTTKDACEYLLNTMDDTQENFVQLLRSTLVSAPVALPVTEPAQKEPEKKADAEPKAGEKPAAEPAAGEEPEAKKE